MKPAEDQFFIAPKPLAPEVLEQYEALRRKLDDEMRIPAELLQGETGSAPAMRALYALYGRRT